MTFAEEKKLRPKEVSKLYGISTAQLCLWRQANKGPAYIQPGPNMVIYLQRDVEAFFQSLRIEPGKRRAK